MRTRRLILREMRFRLGRGILSVFSVTIAIGSLVAALTFLRIHDWRTQQVLTAKATELKQKLARLDDDIRKSMLRLGFNVVILPKGQNLADFYANDFAARDMPEAYVDRLAQSRIVTVRHLLPSLQQKVEWPEFRRTVLLMGTRGETPILHKMPKKSLIQPVARGEMVLGHELARSLKLKKGETVQLMGRSFRITRIHPPRGNKDDITLWIHLKDAQELLHRPGRINAILALECQCSWADLSNVRREITKILPETQVIEQSSSALARAEARRRVAEEGIAAIQREKQGRIVMQRERERLAGLLVGLVMLACVAWVGLLAFGEVRDRRTEIAILRTLGLGSGKIIRLFLIKALIIGAIGGILGVAAGGASGLFLGGLAADSWRSVAAEVLPSFTFLLAALALAPVLSLIAAWIPALIAAGQDPADILRNA